MHDEQDDITLDNEEGIDDSVLAEEAQGDTIKKLKEKLKVAEAKAKEHLDNWQRAQAEFVNLRKRDEEAKSDFLKFAKSDILSELIPVLDALELAVSHGNKDAESIERLLLNILKQHRLSEINPLGEVFDPSKHEAIAMVKTENSEEDNKVIDVFQKGYELDGKIIRPAKVRVGEASA
jgi:molecular chaperone GrpE